MTHRLMVLTLVTAIFSGAALAQDAPSKPPSAQQTACLKAFVPLRQDAELKGRMVRAADERHAPPAEACKLVGDYSAAELRVMKFVEANATQCGIQASVLEQLKAGHKNTEKLLARACTAAERGGWQRATFEGPTWVDDRGDSIFRHAF